MECQQCHMPIDAMANIHQMNQGGDGRWGVGWCGNDIHIECLPIHVRSCRSCWPHNTEYILRSDQRMAADFEAGRKRK